VHDARWAYRFLSKTLNDVFDPTFCVYRVPVYFQILISKITEQHQNFANSDGYTNEDAEINNYYRSLAKICIHRPGMEGVLTSREGVLRGGSVRGTSVRTGGRVC